MSSWNLPRVDAMDVELMNRDVTVEEIKDAMFQMEAEKAPGTDGFTSGFYQRFWEMVGPSVIEFVQ